jgi:predicted MPP superfamily phosphohydrolase
VFFRLFLTAWTVMHLYVFWKAVKTPAITRFIPRRILIPIGVILWGGLLLYRFLDIGTSNIFGHYLELFAMNWLGILFLVSVSLLFFDIVTGFGLFFRRYLPRIRAAAFLVGVLLSAFAFFQAMRPPVIDDYDIQMAKLPQGDDGLTIAVLSDLHLGNLIDENWLAARVDQVNAMHPDLIFVLGDVFEGDSDSERGSNMMIQLRRLSAPLGVWGVTGNHESHGGLEAGVKFLEDSGIRMLRNQWREITPGLVLAGIDDRGRGFARSGRSDRIKQALSGIPPDAATIFLSHRPQGMSLAAKAGVGLMLCGHTHGGQIWPFTYVSAAVNDLLMGKYVIDGMPVLVTRGMGTWGPRMRLWLPGEILRVTLHPAK